VKVSIRPPTVTANNQCFDNDRFNIKFVSRFVDIPDTQEGDKPKNAKTTKGKGDKKTTKDEKKTGKTKKDQKDNKKDRGKPQAPRKSVQNKNKSSRPGTNRSTSTSEQSELEKSEDEIYDIRGMSNSNSQRSKNWRRYSWYKDDFEDEDSSRSSQPMSSSNDEEGQESSRDVVTDLDTDSDESDDQEVVIMYGQIRQISRSSALYDPAAVPPLPNVEVTKAVEDKETLSPLTVVTNSPPVVNPVRVETTNNQPDTSSEHRETATISPHGFIGKEDDNGRAPTSSVRSEAAQKAGRAALARAARQPYKTHSDDLDYRRLGLSLTNDVVTNSPWCISEPSIPELGDSADDDMSSECSLLLEDAALVAARRTTPLYGRGVSPWLTDRSPTDGHSNGRAAATEIRGSTWLSSTPHLTPPPNHTHHHQQPQLQQHAPAKRCRTDSLPAVCCRPRPDTARLYGQLDYLKAPAGVTADLPLEAALDQAERKIIDANVNVNSSTSLPPFLRGNAGPTPAPLPPCLKYPSTSSSTNLQRRRRIRFATDVKQRTLMD